MLITGANGLLGQHLIKLLRQQAGLELFATARGPNRLRDTAGYTYHPADLCNAAQMDALVRDIRPHCIIHAAAMTNVDACEQDQAGCWATNVQATETLVRAAQREGSAFLLLSTDFIFDGVAGPYGEDAIPHPLSHYGMTKLAAEMLLPASGLNWAIARTILVYGIAEDMSRSNIILWVKNNLEQGKRIKVVDDQWRMPTLVQDLAEGCRLIAEKVLTEGRGEPGWPQRVFHISGKDMLTPYEIAQKTAAYFNLDSALIERADGSTFSQAARRPARTGFLLDKAVHQLGYDPHSFEEGLAILATGLT